MINFIKFKAPAFDLFIADDGQAITAVEFKEPQNAQFKQTPLNLKAVKQLAEYFEGKRKAFDLPLNPKGTGFQKKVWACLLKIPYGKTASYKDIAIAAQCPKGFRAVGMANNRNPIAVIIPCHRVVGADGSLTGYGGGLDIKTKLLELEGAKGIKR